MGGRSRSRSASTTTTKIDNSQEVRDFSGATAGAIAGGDLDQSTDISAGGDITFSDFGAVQGGLDLGSKAIDTVANIGATQVAASQKVNEQIGDLASTFAAGDEERNRKLLLYIGAGAAVTVVALVVAVNMGNKR